MDEQYKKGSLSLAGTVAMGTGVMIGAGIFALTGQVAELAGAWFPLAFMSASTVLVAINAKLLKRAKRFVTRLDNQPRGKPVGSL